MRFSELHSVRKAAEDLGIPLRIKSKDGDKEKDAGIIVDPTKDTHAEGRVSDLQIRQLIEVLQTGNFSHPEKGRTGAVRIGNVLYDIEKRFEENNWRRFSPEDRNLYNMAMKLIEQGFYRGAFLDMSSADAAALTFLVNRMAKVKEIPKEARKKRGGTGEKDFARFALTDKEGEPNLIGLMEETTEFAHEFFSGKQLDTRLRQAKTREAALIRESAIESGPNAGEVLAGIEKQKKEKAAQMNAYYEQRKFQEYFSSLAKRLQALMEAIDFEHLDYDKDDRSSKEIAGDGRTMKDACEHLLAAIHDASKKSNDVVGKYIGRKTAAERKLFDVLVPERAGREKMYDALFLLANYLEAQKAADEKTMQDHLGDKEQRVYEGFLESSEELVTTIREIVYGEAQGELREYLDIRQDARQLEKEQKAMRAAQPVLKTVENALAAVRKEIADVEAARQQLLAQGKEMKNVFEDSKQGVVRLITKTPSGDLYLLKTMLVVLDQEKKKPPEAIFMPDSRPPRGGEDTHSFLKKDEEDVSGKYSDVHYFPAHVPFVRMMAEYLRSRQKLAA